MFIIIGAVFFRLRKKKLAGWIRDQLKEGGQGVFITIPLVCVEMLCG